MPNLLDPTESSFKYTALLILLAFALGSIITYEYLKAKTPLHPVKHIVKLQQSTGPRKHAKVIPWVAEKLAPATVEEPTVKVSAADKTPPETKKEFSFRSVGIVELSKDELRHNIERADQLIQENADYYEAYKAKLLSLLALEIKHGAQANIDEYESLYDELLQFEWEGTEDNGSEELTGIDKSLIHIPFLRLSALSDYDELEQLADDYIEEFPASYIGYTYLAEAYLRRGDADLAEEVLDEATKNLSEGEVSASLLEVVSRDPFHRLMGQ